MNITYALAVGLLIFSAIYMSLQNAKLIGRASIAFAGSCGLITMLYLIENPSVLQDNIMRVTAAMSMAVVFSLLIMLRKKYK